MYKIAIFLRTIAKPNIFRNIVLSSLSSDFDKYIVCSAFFQEKNFSTSHEFITSLSKNNTNKEINIFGLYRGSWNKQFNTFCSKLSTCLLNNIKFNYFKFKPNSHAKIFIAKSENNPELAIIGSSNLSAGAFADRNQNQRWNQECDIIFWNKNSQIADSIIRKTLNDLPDELKNYIYISDYDHEHDYFKIKTNNSTCKDKLNNLEELMFSNSNILNY